jgi:hypothetical protein
VVAAGTGLACALLIAWLTWWNGSGYDTPEQAVTASCHAATIMANYTPNRSTDIRIGWEERGQPAGFGWVAVVVHERGGYHVQDCRRQHVAHG